MNHVYSIGMPQLSYNGLDIVWLSKTLGDAHWNMLRSIKSVNKDNQRLYASFFYGELEFYSGQAEYKENDTLSVDSSVFRYSHQIYRSKHLFNNGTAIFDSIFVRKADAGLAKDDPVEAPCFNSTTEISLVKHRALKKKLSSIDFSNFVELKFSPEAYFNGVKILYFANYLNLVYLSEYLEFKKILSPINKLTVYYFGNIDSGDKIYSRSYKEGDKYITILTSNEKVICYCEIRRVG